jgi:ADP-heptose:LPS heptosyltransferase
VALSPDGEAPVRDAAWFRHPGADRGGPVDLAAARRILVVRPDNVGDVVLLTPALRALRAAAPRARLDLLASPAGTAVAPMIPELSGVLTASPSWQQLTAPADPAAAAAVARDERALLDRITAGGYDVMLVFTSFSQSPWPAAHLGLLAGIGTRVVHSREFAGAVATHWVTPPPDTTHHVDRSLHLVEALGATACGRNPTLRVPVAAYAEADAVLAAALDRGCGPRRRPFALLVPGASCPSRRYPTARFGAAAAALASAGLPVLVAGTVAEAGLVAEVVARAGCRTADVPVRPLPPVGLAVFTALIARAAVALTNNSGGLHLADAVGTPVVVTYSGTERLGDVAPRTVPSVLLQVPVPCSPCRQLACPFHLECLDVPPARLAAAALGLASRTSVPTPDIPVSDIPEEDRWPYDPTSRTA